MNAIYREGLEGPIRQHPMVRGPDPYQKPGPVRWEWHLYPPLHPRFVGPGRQILVDPHPTALFRLPQLIELTAPTQFTLTLWI